MAGGNPSKLVPCTPENARERQLKSAKKRKENNEKKKFLSEMYADFLADEYSITKGGETKKISGTEYIKTVVKAIINRGDSSSVTMLREIREATEGTKMQLSGEVTTKWETQEDRLKAFEDLMK